MIRRLQSGARPAWMRWALIGLAVAAVIALVAWRVIDGGEEKEREAARERPVAAPQRVAVVDGATVVTLDEDDLRRSGIQTGRVSTTHGDQTVQAWATVIDPAPLLDLSTGAVNAQVQLTTARAKLAASRAASERAQTLYRDAQNLSLAQAQAAEATFRADQATLAAAEAQVRGAEASGRSQFGPVLGGALGSPLVQNIVQRRSLLLQVTAPPGVSIARPPPSMLIRTDQGGSVQARYVSPAVKTDPKLQSASFYYVAPAAGGLMAGMNVIALLPTGVTQTGVAVPASAVVVWQGQSWVYQRTGARAFRRVMIATTAAAPGGGYLVQTLPANAEVVTSGAQLLLSEEMRPTAQAAAEERD